MVTFTKIQEGGTIAFNGSAHVSLIGDGQITINKPSSADGTMGDSVIVQIGNNIENEAVQVSSVAGTFVSNDVLAAQQAANNMGGGGRGGGGRGGRNGGGGGAREVEALAGAGAGGGGFGGGGAGGGGFGGGGGGRGGGGGGFGGPGAAGGGAGPIGITGTVNLNNDPSISSIVNPSLDPPLPPGTIDNLEARMAARRAAQVGPGN